MHAEGLLELLLVLWLDDGSIHVAHHEGRLLVGRLHLAAGELLLHELVEVDAAVHLGLEAGDWLLVVVGVGGQGGRLAAALDRLDHLTVEEEGVVVVLLSG